MTRGRIIIARSWCWLYQKYLGAWRRFFTTKRNRLTYGETIKYTLLPPYKPPLTVLSTFFIKPTP